MEQFTEFCCRMSMFILLRYSNHDWTKFGLIRKYCLTGPLISLEPETDRSIQIRAIRIFLIDCSYYDTDIQALSVCLQPSSSLLIADCKSERVSPCFIHVSL